MVSQPILRDARVAAALLVSALVVLGGPDRVSAQAPPEENPPETIQPIVLDLSNQAADARAAMRKEIAAAISANPRLSPIEDDDLDAALSGDLARGAVRRGREAAAAATAGACPEIAAAAQAATLELGAAQAAGAEVSADLRAVYGALFRCAADGGDPGLALRHAQTLRALGQIGPPANIDAATWALYPTLDAAANVSLAAVEIESPEPGASVWIDHQKVGVTPLALHLSQGSHLVALGSPRGIAAMTIDVRGWSHKETLTPAPSVGRWSQLAALVVELRSDRRGADAKAIGEVISLAGAQLALVVVSGGTIEAWRASDRGAAVRIGQRRDAGQAAALIAGGRVNRAPDPSTELLRETPAERAARKRVADDDKPAKWWVYAAVVGAAAVGAGIIVFGTSGDDRQRFEITLP